MYKNYIFDLYGTLVDIRTNESKRYLWNKIALFYGFNGAEYNPTELKKEYGILCKQEEEKMTKLDYDYPEIELQFVFQKLFQNKKVEANLELAAQAGRIFRILSIEHIRLYDGVMELLGSLKKAGKKIFLLSNAQHIFTEPEMRLLNIYDCFDGIVISSDEGCKKPSSLFYQVVLDRYQLDKKESIMIGNDAITDIKGSYDSGISSLYIHSNLSPEIEGELLSKYSIMDGEISKVNKLIQL